MLSIFNSSPPGSIELEIDFEKVDGTRRVLIATTDIPEDQIPNEAANPSKLDLSTHARVFDKEAKGWRTIILKNINTITVRV